MDALSALQAARNVLDACEVELLGQVAAIELVPLEDGTEDVRHPAGVPDRRAPAPPP